MKPSRKMPHALLLLVLFAFSPTCSIQRSASNPVAEKKSLTIEEYALESLTCEADPEARCFVPVSGTYESVMALRALERERRHDTTKLASEDSFSVPFNGEQLKAKIVLITEEETPELSVQVEHGDEAIFTRSLGPPSPVDPLQGLWVYEGHWCLEAAENVSASEHAETSGVIVCDGEVLDEPPGIEEAFGFALLDGKPFYFFRNSGGVDLSFDDQIIPVGYEHIAHYGCCSAAHLNPARAENMISFFAQREGIWYYVEAGVYP